MAGASVRTTNKLTLQVTAEKGEERRQWVAAAMSGATHQICTE